MTADLLALLNADTAVNDLAAGRLYWQHPPQAPATDAVWATLIRTSGAIGMRHDGPSLLNDARIQVDCFAPTYAQAKALRDAITAAVGGKPAVIQGASDFRAFIPQPPRDFPPVKGIHRCMADMLVTWRPAPVV